MTLTERDFSDTLLLLTDFNIKRLLVAFSGGCDSLALLSLSIKALGKDNVVACYVNHRLRSEKELEKELALNKQNCEKLGVVLEVVDLQENTVELLAKERKNGIEEAARVLRYKALNDVSLKYNCNYIATAHHLQDQVETVLMRIIKHSPITSLRGISEVSSNIIRPLLSYSKEDLICYNRQKGLVWATDSTNSDISFTRNEIRNEIIPELSKIMPDYEKRILALKDRVVSLCSNLDFEVSDIVDLTCFKSLSREKQMLVLYQMWDKYVTGILPQSLIDRVLSSDKDQIVSSNGGCFSIYNNKLYVTCNSDDSKYEKFSSPLRNGPLIGSLKVVISDKGESSDIFITSDMFDPDFTIRFVKIGDEISLKDGKKKVLRLLQDMKIPPALRGRVPLLTLNDQVIAVFGSVYGGKNRLDLRYRSSLASCKYYKYICIKR